MTFSLSKHVDIKAAVSSPFLLLSPRNPQSDLSPPSPSLLHSDALPVAQHYHHNPIPDPPHRHLLLSILSNLPPHLSKISIRAPLNLQLQFSSSHQLQPTIQERSFPPRLALLPLPHPPPPQHNPALERSSLVRSGRLPPSSQTQTWRLVTAPYDPGDASLLADSTA